MTSRSPTTMSAWPSRIGSTSAHDVGAVILVVRVGVDDDVRPELEAGVEPRLEAGGQPLVVGQADDVVDAVLARDLDGPIRRAIVDDEPLDLVEPRDLAGEVAQGDGEGFLLVLARDLDDELHGPDSGRYNARPDGLPAARPRAERRHGRRGGLRRALRRRRRRLLPLSDLPQLRLLLLAAVGPRAARRHDAGVRGLPRADRASARDRRRRAAEPARRVRRPRLGGHVLRLLPLARVGHLPARPRRLHAARSARSPRCCCSRGWTSPSSPRAATSTSPTWRSWCGRRCSRRGGRAPARPCSCCWRSPGCCGRRRGCCPGSTGCGWRGGRAGGRGSGTPRWSRSRRCCGSRLDFAVTGDPLFSLHYTSSSAEELGRQRTLERDPRRGARVLRPARQAARRPGRRAGRRDRGAGSRPGAWPCR